MNTSREMEDASWVDRMRRTDVDPIDIAYPGHGGGDSRQLCWPFDDAVLAAQCSTTALDTTGHSGRDRA